jgi:hypothetical protein
MRLTKSDELPGESTVEAVGATSRSRGARRQDPGQGFTKLPGGAAWLGNGAKAAAAWAPQVVAGVCIGRSGGGLRFGPSGAGREEEEGERFWFRASTSPVDQARGTELK